MTTLVAPRYDTAFQTRSRRIFTIRGRAKNESYVEEKAVSHRQNRSLDYALSRLDLVTGVDMDCVNTLRTFLKYVLKDYMAFATVITDDEGYVSAQWRSGLSYISLEVGLSESSLVYSNSQGELEVNETGKNSLNAPLVASILDRFTTELNATNSQWRTYFI